MRKQEVNLNNKSIAEYIFNDYLCSIENDEIERVISKLPLLVNNNLACKISGRDYLDIADISTYKIFSKFITKYNKSLKMYRRPLLDSEFGRDGNVHANTDTRLVKLSKYGLDAGNYFVELDESEYAIFNVEFDSDDIYLVKYTIWFVGNKWKKFRDKFLSMVNDYKSIKKECKNSERINYTNGKPSVPAIFKSFDKVIFTGKQEILSYIDNFINNIPEYYKFGMTPKLSIMIHGKPGTGKSTFAKALANYLGISSVTSVSSDYFNEENANASNYQPRRYRSNLYYGETVYVLDDIDCICKSREEDDSQDNSKIMASLLSFLDNPPTIDFAAKDNVIYPISIVVATTNYYDKLDDAVKRFGRFDLTIEMKEFNKSEAEEMCNVYNLTLDDVIKNEEYKKKNFVISPSKLQALCLENIDKSLKNTQ